MQRLSGLSGGSDPDPDTALSGICFEEKATQVRRLAGYRIKRNAIQLFILQTYKYPMLVCQVCLFDPKTKVSRILDACTDV